MKSESEKRKAKSENATVEGRGSLGCGVEGMYIQHRTVQDNTCLRETARGAVGQLRQAKSRMTTTLGPMSWPIRDTKAHVYLLEADIQYGVEYRTCPELQMHVLNMYLRITEYRPGTALVPRLYPPGSVSAGTHRAWLRKYLHTEIRCDFCLTTNHGGNAGIRPS